MMSRLKASYSVMWRPEGWIMLSACLLMKEAVVVMSLQAWSQPQYTSVKPSSKTKEKERAILNRVAMSRNDTEADSRFERMLSFGGVASDAALLSLLQSSIVECDLSQKAFKFLPDDALKTKKQEKFFDICIHRADAAYGHSIVPLIVKSSTPKSSNDYKSLRPSRTSFCFGLKPMSSQIQQQPLASSTYRVLETMLIPVVVAITLLLMGITLIIALYQSIQLVRKESNLMPVSLSEVTSEKNSTNNEATLSPTPFQQEEEKLEPTIQMLAPQMNTNSIMRQRNIPLAVPLDAIITAHPKQQRARGRWLSQSDLPMSTNRTDADIHSLYRVKKRRKHRFTPAAGNQTAIPSKEQRQRRRSAASPAISSLASNSSLASSLDYDDHTRIRERDFVLAT